MERTASQAFAAQAASDLDTYLLLAGSSLPSCHRLHYLQMWLEKLCKAYLWLPESANEELRTRHGVVEKILPRIIGEHWRRIGFEQRPDLDSIRQICREIDLLHPQIDANERRPDNVEYPWVGPSGNQEVPALWDFPLASRLYKSRTAIAQSRYSFNPPFRCFATLAARGGYPRLRHKNQANQSPAASNSKIEYAGFFCYPLPGDLI